MPQKSISGSSLSGILLRQAEERTKLVVECAGMLRRLEALDSEISAHGEWQRYPTNWFNVKSNVQIRFEEAHRREVEEAGRIGADGWLSFASLADMPLVPKAPQSPAPALRNPRPQTASTPRGLVAKEEEEASLAFKILQRVLHAAEFEAEVWRHRAHDAALTSDWERGQARRLMEFEISAALQESEEERARSALLLRDRDAAFEKVENELKNAKSDLEVQRLHVANLKRELQDVLAHSDQEVLQARSQRDNAIRISESQRTELCRANEATVAALKAELAVAKRDAQGGVAEKKKQRDLVSQLEAQVSYLRSECEMHRKECDGKVEDLARTNLRLETFEAKCGNLQVALENATRRQAELTIERNALMNKTNNLVGVQQRIGLEVDALQDSIEKIVNLDTQLGQKQFGSKLVLDDSFEFGVSTASTVVGSGASSPRDSLPSVSPPLPLVRPNSAKRMSPNWRRELLTPVGLPVP